MFPPVCPVQCDDAKRCANDDAVVPENWSPVVERLQAFLRFGIKARQQKSGFGLWGTGKIPDPLAPRPKRLRPRWSNCAA